MNEFIFLIEIIITLFSLVLANKLFGKNGLYFWLIISIILSIILSFKSINLFSCEVNLGIVPYVSNFICMNILIQKYGQEQNKKIIICAIISIVITYLLIILLNSYEINNINLINNTAFINIFKLDLIKSVAFIITYIASALANIELYYQIRKTKNKIWISNFTSIVIIQFTDTMLFSLIAYLNFIDTINFIITIIITTAIKYIIGFIGTSTIYICQKIED